MYKNPRPAGSRQADMTVQNCSCDPAVSTFSWGASLDLVVRYNYEPGGTAEQTTHKWFYDNGSFGSTAGGAIDNDNIRCGLLPADTSRCCCPNSPYDCGSSTYRSFIQSVGGNCTGTLGTLTRLQQNAILQGSSSPPSMTQPNQTQTCEDSSTRTFRPLCQYEDSDSYAWLLGISDYSTSAAKFKHMVYNSSSDVAEWVSGTRHLANTLVAVFHSEIWFKACDKSPAGISEGPVAGGNSHCEDNGSIWRCRVPEWWAYGCSGIPVFSWEIGQMLDNGKISQTEANHFFRSIHNGTAIGATELGVGLLEKLETLTHCTTASDGVGVLQTRDWAGYTRHDDSTVEDSERRIIRKDLSTWPSGTSGSETIVRDVFFYGRPGGWSHICRYPLGGTASVTDKIPQVPRSVGWRDGSAKCAAAGVDYSCLTAAALPYSGTTTCTDVQTACGCGLCDSTEVNSCGELVGNLPPTGCTGLGDCTLGLSAGCGGPGVGFTETCNQTTYNATCGGIHFQFSSYRAKITDSPPPHACQEKNDAWLWVINRNCDESDSSEPKNCSSPNCPPSVYDNLGDVYHWIHPEIAENQRCGDGGADSDDSCDGMQGTIAKGSELCQATTPNKRADGTKRDPGSGMAAPFDINGCGQYLCNDKGPGILGCCCKTDTTSGTTTCIDAVTAEQCAACANDANTTTVWKGPGTCCAANPC
tara:strand:+ start:1218 stop:3311 length:2094 start_codon:yes stop_codon:yes gene_type:complete